MRKYPVQHGFYDKEEPDNESWVMTHCLGPDDETCWCEADLHTLCECGAYSTDHEKEEWQPECEYCDDSGFRDAENEPDNAFLFLAHYDR